MSNSNQIGETSNSNQIRELSNSNQIGEMSNSKILLSSLLNNVTDEWRRASLSKPDDLFLFLDNDVIIWKTTGIKGWTALSLSFDYDTL